MADTTAHRLKPGDPAPAFTLPDSSGQSVSLADYRGRQVVIYFYPAAGTPGCTVEACDFRDNLSALQSVGLDVLGISPDSQADLAAFRDDHGLTFPLLSDPERTALTAYGAWGEKNRYGRVTLGVIRSTVVVDDTGHVSRAYYNVRAKGHVSRLRADLVPAGAE